MLKQTLAIAAGCALLAASAVAGAGAKGKDNVVWPGDAIKWENGPVPGTRVAKLWGDWEKGGPYGVLIKFDAGVMHKVHHHTQSLKTVIISGTFVFHPEGGQETRLGPGSYLLQQGGKKHVSGCAEGAECEFFMTSSDKFDYLDDSGEGDKKADAAMKDEGAAKK